MGCGWDEELGRDAAQWSSTCLLHAAAGGPHPALQYVGGWTIGSRIEASLHCMESLGRKVKEEIGAHLSKLGSKDPH